MLVVFILLAGLLHGNPGNFHAGQVVVPVGPWEDTGEALFKRAHASAGTRNGGEPVRPLVSLNLTSQSR